MPLVFAIFAVGMASAVATEQKLQAKLIWGTDKDDPKLKQVDQKLKKKFSEIVKWQNYFEVEQKHFAVAPDAVKKVTMSPKCEIEVRNEGNGMFEVRLYGEGKCLNKMRQAIPAGDFLVIAGHDKDATAWFVVLNIE